MKEKIVQIHFRVTEKERREFKRNAVKCGLTLSEYLRKLAAGHEPKSLPPIQYGELISILSNLYSEFQRQGRKEAVEKILHLAALLTDAISPEGNKNGNNEDMASS